MKRFEAPVSALVADFLAETLPVQRDMATANKHLQAVCGVTNWFGSEAEFLRAQEALTQQAPLVEEDRTEYGDFQTNEILVQRVVQLLAGRRVAPDVVVEPTCGKGTFLLAALAAFPNVRRMVGIEIYRPYVWEAKFRLLHYFLDHPLAPKPLIQIVHEDVFAYPFPAIRPQFPGEKLLVLGNPPWVTNSQLGSLHSTNLPTKSNFKGVSGLDALTGKGNFDLGEFIVLALLDAFKDWPGSVALLVKTAVIRNLIHGQKKHPRSFGAAALYRFDAKKEFGAAVDAALFTAELGTTPAQTCQEYALESPQRVLNTFGWVAGRFVSQTETYQALRELDGRCPYEWRQGIKHDCSSVMELEGRPAGYGNALGETIDLEPDLVYSFLKSSDLKAAVIETSRKVVLVPQRKVGQDTRYLQDEYPKTFGYLKRHERLFAARKSSIYRGKPLFSIFGIGDYSFKPYKVALSGLYKAVNFALVFPIQEKPVMLDDTCYFLGFDDFREAVCTWLTLNHSLTRQLLTALSFSDAKRPYTKDLLMRLDLRTISRRIDFAEIEGQATRFGLDLNEWERFIQQDENLAPVPQLTLFG